MIDLKSHILRQKSVSAFSLLELLIVIGIMTLLASLIVPVLGAANGRRLASGGNMVVDLARNARQNSMANGSMTALVLVTDSSVSDWNNRLMVLVELKPGASAWSQLTKWEMLPKGVVVDRSQSADFLSLPNPAPTPALLPLNFSGRAIAVGQYSYQIFLPDGRILPNGGNPPALRLVEGVMNGSDLVYTTIKNGANARNYYNITLNAYTGLPKVDRP